MFCIEMKRNITQIGLLTTCTSVLMSLLDFDFDFNHDVREKEIVRQKKRERERDKKREGEKRD